MVAIGGRIETVIVSITAGVDEWLTQSRAIVEEPSLNMFCAIARLDRQKAFLQQSTERLSCVDCDAHSNKNARNDTTQRHLNVDTDDQIVYNYCLYLR